MSTTGPQVRITPNVDGSYTAVQGRFRIWPVAMWDGASNKAHSQWCIEDTSGAEPFWNKRTRGYRDRTTVYDLDEARTRIGYVLRDEDTST